MMVSGLLPDQLRTFFFLHGIIKKIISKQIPILITGDAYKTLIEVLISTYLLDTKNEKLISENLVEGEQFEKIVISPNSKELNQLYENYSNIELTSNRYSLYPKLIEYLNNNIADIDAFNQFGEPEIISLKNKAFFLACGFCPQISSTRERPHPIIYTFMKACQIPIDNG